MMNSIQLDKDILSLSEFRSNSAAYVEEIKSNKRPVILTQNGKSALVVMDVSAYQQLMNKLTLLEEITQAKTEIEQGLGKSHDLFINELRAKYNP